MLNAFRHQRTVHVSDGARQGPGSTHVLNAFRHQRTVHARDPHPSNQPSSVLNAFRHQRTVHLARLRGVHHGGVLNAFRHQRTVHDATVTHTTPLLECAQRLSASTNCSRKLRIRNASAIKMCSTPFGINELFTSPRLPPNSRACIGAQRLSASTNCSRNVLLGGGTPRPKCSTPFGINELFTRASPGEARRPPGAQRLSASTNCSQSRSTRPHSPPSTVLNAFRHQRTVHERDLERLRTAYLVLNAFRHQRTVHRRSAVSPRLVTNRAQRLSASTNCSLDRFNFTQFGQIVLNAFRHQRTVHFGGHVHMLALLACSTPFGINELFTACVASQLRSIRGAQRLSASTNCSLEPTRSTPTGNQVLNAFRHQRTDHDRLPGAN